MYIYILNIHDIRNTHMGKAWLGKCASLTGYFSLAS